MDQLDMRLQIDTNHLATFLAQWVNLEEQEDALRETKRLLKEEYARHLPLRAVTTAIKVIRARTTLERHAKEPMSLMQQGLLEAQVERWLAAREAGLDLPALVPQMGRED